MKPAAKDFSSARTIAGYAVRRPIATVMLHDLIDYATSERFAPKKRLP